MWCDKFVYIEILKRDNILPDTLMKEEIKTKNKPKDEAVGRIDQDLTNLLKESIEEVSDDSGWVFLGVLDNHIIKKRKDFDPRNYGFSKLYPLIKQTDIFDIEIRKTGDNQNGHIYIKNRISG